MRIRNRRSSVRTGLLAVALSAAALLAPLGVVAGAQEPPPPENDAPEFAIQPSGPEGPGGRDYFVYDLAPGETFGDTVGVSNLGDEPVTFAVYATDAFSAENATFALLREDEEPVDVGTWIQLAATTYTVEPGQRADIPFAITIPEDASPGDHVGAIVAQPLVAPTTSDGQFDFDVRLRIGARMYVRVAGDAHPSLRVDRLDLRYSQGLGLTSGEQRLEYVVRNDGNLRLTPTARVRIEGPLGITVRTLPDRSLPELLPGAEITIAETVKGLPLLGRLRAVVEVDAPEAETSAGVATWAVPWVLVALAVVLGAAYGWRRWRRSRRREPAPPSPEQRRPVHA